MSALGRSCGAGGAGGETFGPGAGGLLQDDGAGAGVGGRLLQQPDEAVAVVGGEGVHGFGTVEGDPGGWLLLDELVTVTYPVEDLAKAVADAGAGRVARGC